MGIHTIFVWSFTGPGSVEWITCGDCGGSGFSVTDFNETKLSCLACNGSGTMSSFNTCSACSGSGSVTFGDQCNDCAGLGKKIAGDCRVCHGNGQNTNFLLGDANFDGKVDLVDLLMAIDDIFDREPFSSDAFFVADVNGDGKIDLQDLLGIIDIIFKK